MYSKLKKAEYKVYKLLKESGRRTEIGEILEYIIGGVICLNVVLIIVESLYKNTEYNGILNTLRTVFFVFFLIEYILRLWIADYVMHDTEHPMKARIRYIFTFNAIIDLMALLPVLLGGTIIDFRIFRVLRLLRIAQMKSLRRHTIILTKVLKLKGRQLLASLFLVIIFMLVSAVIIHDLENKAQPEVFQSVLSGLWWSISAITTIGYGDMYPITPLGKVLGACMSIFGVFLMAVPIGILTSGFFEVSRKIKSNEKEKPLDDKESESESEEKNSYS